MRALMRRRVPFFLIAAAGLLLFVIWRTTPVPADDAPAPPEPASVASPTSASASASPFWDLAAQASARADSAEAASPMDLQRWERDWCKQHGERLEALTPEQLQALLEGKEIQEAAAALKTQARARLQALRHPRAAAALEAFDALNDSAEAMASLRERARRSDDAFVVALALQNACTDAACQRELSRRWQQLEPHNLHAYLWELRRDDMSTLPFVLSGVTQASSSKSYYYEFMDLLREASAMSSQGPLAQLIEIDLTKRIGGRNELHVFGLVTACQEAGPTENLSALCTSAAEKIWTLNEEMLMLAMVSAVMAKTEAEPPAHWRERSRLVDAAKQVLRDTSHTANTEGLARRFDAAMRCQPLEPGLHQQIWRELEWALLKRTVQQRELSARTGQTKQSRPLTPPVP